MATRWEQALGALAGEKATCRPLLLLADNLSVETARQLDEIEAPADPDQVTASVYYDAPAGNFDAAEIERHLIAFAKRSGISFFQGRGIASYVLAESTKSGSLVASVGDEVALLGGVGALTLSIDESQALELLRTGTFETVVPQTIHVALAGCLPQDTCAKDAWLTMAKTLAPKIEGRAVELVGETVSTLSRKDAEDLCLIMRRAGAHSCVCETELAPLGSDKVVDLTFDLADAAPQAIEPGSFSQVKALEDIVGTQVDACFIGGRTGGAIEDLRVAREVLAGHDIPLAVRVCVAPATNEVFSQAIEEGIIEDLIDAGAQILNAGTDSCCTTSKGVVGAGETLFATSVWNEPGCAGSPEAQVYLGSTQAVAAAALTGSIALPASHQVHRDGVTSAPAAKEA